MIDQLVKDFDFQRAKKGLEGVILETKLLHSRMFSKETGNQIYIKPENLQITGSFKVRGAFNKISKLSEEEKSRGIITSSAGNHAQGCAMAAQKLGIKATIVMPTTTPLVKINATRSYGAQVVLAGEVYDEAYEEACRLEKEHGYTFVHAFDDLDVIEGQGTIALEILEELRDTEYILAPVGGGGLISGIALAAKEINPDIKIIGVEPEGAASMKMALESLKIESLKNVCTIADGCAVGRSGQNTYEITRQYVDDIITVTDDELMETFLILVENHRLVAENAGLLSLAAVNKLGLKDKKIVCLISGGNIDVLSINTLINQGLVSRGRKCCFTINLVDKPGELIKITEILSSQGANIIDLSHNRYRGVNRYKDVLLEIVVDTESHEHIERIMNEFKNRAYEIRRKY